MAYLVFFMLRQAQHDFVFFITLSLSKGDRLEPYVCVIP